MKQWDALLNGELFYALHEVRVIVEGWRRGQEACVSPLPRKTLDAAPPEPPKTKGWPLLKATSASRSLVMICSTVCLIRGIGPSLRPDPNIQVGSG